MRKLAWFSGGFALACLLSAYALGGPLPALIAAGLCAGAFAALLLTRPRGFESPDLSLLPAGRRAAFQIARRLAALCLGAALAFGWAAGYAEIFRAPAEALAGAEQTLTGTVASYPRETSIGGRSLTVKLDGGLAAPDVLLYAGADWADLRPGDRITCTARLRSSDFLYGDETTYYTAKGIYLLAYCNDPPQAERAEAVPLRYWPALCAHALRGGISAAFGGEGAPLAAAVTLGDKSGLDEGLYTALTRSGLMHAAVVSGMHISFLAGMIVFLFRGSRRAALCAVPILLFYALMAGGTPSALRAVIMQAVILAGPLLNREPDPPTALGLALLVLLLQNPFAAASVSLQLSFASVAGIQLVSARMIQALEGPVKRKLRGGGLPRRALRGGWRLLVSNLSVTLGAMVFTAPLIALYFGKLVLVSPLTNLLCLWAVTVLLILALLAGTLGIFLPGAAAVLRPILLLPARWLAAVTGALARLPMACLSSEDRNVRIWLAAVYVLALSVALARRKLRQTLLALSCAGALLALAIGLNALSVRRADLTVAALDVGQGASTLILSGDSAVLADCGGSGTDSAGDIAADRLALLGRRTLDALVFTHLDADHFNGAERLFARLKVRRVYVPDVGSHQEELAALRALAEDAGAEVIPVSAVTVIPAGSASVTLYPPMGSGTSNEEGLFLLATAGDFDALITGDADAFVEDLLVKYRPIPDIELLLVGHHGSAGSTGQGLLDALRPELAVISVGYNSYGHPAQPVLDRLRAAGAEVWRTDTDGSVTVTLRDGRVSVQTQP